LRCARCHWLRMALPLAMVPLGQQGRLFQIRCSIWCARIQGVMVPYPKIECGKSAGATLGTSTVLAIAMIPQRDADKRPAHHRALFCPTTSEPAGRVRRLMMWTPPFASFAARPSCAPIPPAKGLAAHSPFRIHPTSTPSGSGSTIAVDQAATARRAACQFHGRRSAILFAG
jgi:hypothetical protein